MPLYLSLKKKTVINILNFLFIYRMVKIHKKIVKETALLDFFTTNEWNFEDNNVRALSKQMNETDRNVFRVDTNGFDWEKYMEMYCFGIRKYLLNQNAESLPQARKYLQKYGF